MLPSDSMSSPSEATSTAAECVCSLDIAKLRAGVAPISDEGLSKEGSAGFALSGKAPANALAGREVRGGVPSNEVRGGAMPSKEGRERTQELQADAASSSGSWAGGACSSREGVCAGVAPSREAHGGMLSRWPAESSCTTGVQQGCRGSKAVRGCTTDEI